MPRVHTQTARKDLYYRGKRIEDPKTKSGYRLDRSQPADEDDKVQIKKGQVYYRWKFRYGGEIRSTVRPRPSQLTQSSFLSQAYALQERLEDFVGTEWQDIVDEAVALADEARELADECQNSLDNMPYQLQESDTGYLLQERIEEMEQFASECEEFQDEGTLQDQYEDYEDAQEAFQSLCINV